MSAALPVVYTVVGPDGLPVCRASGVPFDTQDADEALDELLYRRARSEAEYEMRVVAAPSLPSTTVHPAAR